jgi:hypothetical protein
VNDLRLELLDADTKEEKPICSTHFSLLPYMKVLPDDATQDECDMFYMILIDPKDDMSKKEIKCGHIRMRVRFLPGGS